MSEIYYRNKNEKGKIDKNLVNANIKLVDENKYIKEQIQKAIEYIENNTKEWVHDDYDTTIYNALNQEECDELLKMLKGLVE